MLKFTPYSFTMKSRQARFRLLYLVVISIITGCANDTVGSNKQVTRKYFSNPADAEADWVSVNSKAHNTGYAPTDPNTVKVILPENAAGHAFKVIGIIKTDDVNFKFQFRRHAGMLGAEAVIIDGLSTERPTGTFITQPRSILIGRAIVWLKGDEIPTNQVPASVIRSGTAQ